MRNSVKFLLTLTYSLVSLTKAISTKPVSSTTITTSIEINESYSTSFDTSTITKSILSTIYTTTYPSMNSLIEHHNIIHAVIPIYIYLGCICFYLLLTKLDGYIKKRIHNIQFGYNETNNRSRARSSNESTSDDIQYDLGESNYICNKAFEEPKFEKMYSEVKVNEYDETLEYVCAICIETLDLKSNEVVKLNGCSHLYHKNCINPWLKTIHDVLFVEILSYLW